MKVIQSSMGEMLGKDPVVHKQKMVTVLSITEVGEDMYILTAICHLDFRKVK